jgi:hypothetical protein
VALDWRSEMLTTNLDRNRGTVNELSNGVVERQLASGVSHFSQDGDGAGAHRRHPGEEVNDLLFVVCETVGVELLLSLFHNER